MYQSFLEYLENKNDQHQYSEYWGNQGAGILVIAKDTGKWLVALRGSKVKQPLTWAVVGGKINENEYPQQAAKREFTEETGYHGKLDLHKVYEWKSPETNNNKPVFIYHNFIGEITKGKWEPQKNFETEEFRWCTYQDLQKLKPMHFGLTALLKHSREIKTLSEKYQGTK